MSPKLIVQPLTPCNTRVLRVGWLIPRIVFLIAVLIVVSGFLPLRWFRFQDYEIARQVLQWDAPFMPNLRMRTAFFEGNEAFAGNLRPTERLGWRNFTTDNFGFRFTPPVRGSLAPELVVFRGFSFVFGLGFGDEETFPAVLSRQVGVNAYNAARFHDDPETPEDFDRLMAKVGARPKTVVYVHLEPNAFVLTPSAKRLDPGRRLFRFAKEFPLTWVRTSPLILNAAVAKRAVENDLILNNRYRENVRSFALPSGSPMLVLKGDLERAQTSFDDSIVADRSAYIEWWNARMVERGARMIVLLVPDKLSVYGPSLGVSLPADPYLDRMERDLASRGIRVVNGLPLLRATAAADLASGRLSYLREDQHWSAEGVKRLARATAQAISAIPVIESSGIR
jgi:hypothetical protein